MKKIGFKLFLIFEKFVALLPFKIIYYISDFIYFIIKYIIRYRKQVIRKNLRNSFPKKNIVEIKEIEKIYLHIICDLIVETIKMIHLNKEKTLKMFEINNMELLNKLYSDKKSVFLALGHTASWELTGMILPLLTKYETYGIYLPLKNSYFDKHIKDIRGKFGLELIPSQQIFRFLYHKKNDLVLTYILADQSPPKNSDNYWVNFLNQDTAFSKGLEKMSKSLNYAVVFLNIVKLKGADIYLILN